MRIKPIRSESSYREALAEVDRLERLEPEDSSPEGEALEILYTLVEAYEEEHRPIEPPDPIDAILFRMDQMGWGRKDLEPLIGSRARVSEVLSGTRPLSITMIRRLAEIGIPAEVLIRESRGQRKSVVAERPAVYRRQKKGRSRKRKH